jgi:hypothetical protein
MRCIFIIYVLKTKGRGLGLKPWGIPRDDKPIIKSPQVTVKVPVKLQVNKFDLEDQKGGGTTCFPCIYG